MWPPIRLANSSSKRGWRNWNGAAVDRHPLEAISHYLDLYRLDDQPGLPPFQGGAIGYFSYEFGRLLERLPQPDAPAQGSMPDAAWYFYDVVLAFDHQAGKVWLLSSGLPEADEAARQRKSIERSESFLRLLREQPRTGDFESRAAADCAGVLAIEFRA